MQAKNHVLLFVIAIAICAFVSGCSPTDIVSESEEAYKTNAVFVDDIQSFTNNPDNFRGKKIQLALTVYDVHENGKDINIYASPGGLDLNGQMILFHYKMKDGDQKINKGDLVRFYGEYKGLSDSKEIAVMGQPKKVIECNAKVISKPLWGGLYDMSPMARQHLVATIDGRKVVFAFTRPSVNATSIDIAAGAAGITPEQNTVAGIRGTVKFKGSITDTGEGEFQYLDNDGNPTGATFSLKLADLKSGTISTDEVAATYKTGNPFDSFSDPQEGVAVLKAGSYDVKTDL